MINEEIKNVVIDVVVKNGAELEKIHRNLEGISKFAEKLGGRYEIRMKFDKTLFRYLSKINIPLPLPVEKEFHLNLMKVLGFSHLYFYIYTITSNKYIILIYLIDSLINYDLKRNTEIVKCGGNVVNGILGMKRDTNLQLVVFLLCYDDVREVFVIYFIS
jgi:hypothetical protein